MPMVVKRVLMLLFHFIVTEMKEDTVNSNAIYIYMVEIENLYASRNDMLISIFSNFILLQIISNYKLSIDSNMEKWKFIINIGIFIAYLRLGTWFIITCNLYSYYLQFCKTM